MDALVSVFLELVKISLTAGMIAGIILSIRAVIGKKFYQYFHSHGVYPAIYD